MSSHSSNNSNTDMEVINAEDLEDSTPPGDAEDVTVFEEKQDAQETKEEDVVVEATASGDTEQIGEIVDVEVAPVEAAADPTPSASLVETPAAAPAAANEDDDDPPIEILEAPTTPLAEPELEVAPVVEVTPVVTAATEAVAGDPTPAVAIVETPAPTPAAAPAPAPVPASQPPIVSVRPTVTAERPAATLEEVDDEEEDDDDIDETLAERLVGLTEMFPDFVRNGSVSLVKGSWSLTHSCYSLGRAASWVVFSSATILFMPIMIESERLQMQDQMKAQKNQILLGPGAAVSGGPSLGPPPI